MPAYYARPGRPRSSGRLARSPQLAAELSARLTARDRWLLRMICEHRVLTTDQVTQLAFGTSRAATARMTTLYQYRAVDRFRPLAPAGSSPLHFILDEGGAMLLAAEDGITAADLGYRRDRSMAIALSPRLAHDTGANGVFTARAAAARASGGQRGEDPVRPDIMGEAGGQRDRHGAVAAVAEVRGGDAVLGRDQHRAGLVQDEVQRGRPGGGEGPEPVDGPVLVQGRHPGGRGPGGAERELGDLAGGQDAVLADHAQQPPVAGGEPGGERGGQGGAAGEPSRGAGAAGQGVR